MKKIENIEHIRVKYSDVNIGFDFELYFNDDKKSETRGYYMKSTPILLNDNGELKRRFSDLQGLTLLLEADYETETKLKEALIYRDKEIEKMSNEIENNYDFLEEIIDLMMEDQEIKMEQRENKSKETPSNESGSKRANERISRRSKKSEDKEFHSEEKPDVRFDDVAGLKEVKEELYEIVDAVKNKEVYEKMGAKLPRGVLFYGPPGTGKTLIAKAIAGETESSFFSVSGSEFMEKYVGVGAKRIRELFAQAKKKAPSIIFIDEIDAIGNRRESDTHNERVQTLNQLLVELDGFNNNKEDVVIIGATNRKELLDEALIRAGRLSKHIYIGNPDLESRKELFEIHTKNKPLNECVDLDELAKKTHGFNGADIENIANEGALLAIREKRQDISHKNLEDALEKVIGGLTTKSKKLRDVEKSLVSYHEAGHALVGMLLGVNRIQKISIIPHGQALGFVINLPEEDKHLSTKEDLENELQMLLAGRVAEEVKFGYYSTGASGDLRKATKIATSMVCNYGMSKSVGLFSRELSSLDKLTKVEREEINRVLEDMYRKTEELIESNMDRLEKIANYLYENEEMTNSDIKMLFEEDELLATI